MGGGNLQTIQTKQADDKTPMAVHDGVAFGDVVQTGVTQNDWPRNGMARFPVVGRIHTRRNERKRHVILAHTACRVRIGSAGLTPGRSGVGGQVVGARLSQLGRWLLVYKEGYFVCLLRVCCAISQPAEHLALVLATRLCSVPIVRGENRAASCCHGFIQVPEAKDHIR